jgi:hypothetical protein
MNSLIFQYGSAIVGGLAVLSVCLVFVKVHKYEKSGFGLLICGTILIGLPVWSSAKFAWNSDGLELEFKTISQKLDSLETKIASSGVVSSEVRTELARLAKAIQKVQTTSNLALATFASSPSLSKANSPLAKAYSRLATGNDRGEVAAFIRDPEDALIILRKTEALTERLNQKVQIQAAEQNRP